MTAAPTRGRASRALNMLEVASKSNLFGERTDQPEIATVYIFLT
jgi:hypothetical protein